MQGKAEHAKAEHGKVEHGELLGLSMGRDTSGDLSVGNPSGDVHLRPRSPAHGENRPRKSITSSSSNRPSSRRVSYLSSGTEVELDCSTIAPRLSLALINGQVLSFEYSPPSHRFIIDPLTKSKIIWDLVLLLLILYQAMLVPVELSFVDSMTLAEPYNAIWCIEFTMGALFTVDILLSCLTAYIKHDGTYVRNQRMIIRNYALSLPYFMIMDLVSLLPFVLSVVELTHQDSSASAVLGKASKSGRFIKYARLFRMLRLLRLARAMRVIQNISKVMILQGRYMVFATEIVKLLLGFFLLVHVGACIWRGTADFEHHAESQNVQTMTVWECYTFSVWWMIMTFSGGAPPLWPTAGWERWIWSGFGCLALCVVTVLTGKLVQIFNRFNEELVELDQKLRVASKFISDHPIPEHLKASVLGAVRTSFRHHRDTGKFQELVDPLLSEDLRRKLYGSIYGPVLRWFPPFRDQCVPDRFLAKLAITERMERYGRSDVILHEGMVEDSMTIMVDGSATLHSNTKRMKLPVVAAKWFLGERALFWDARLGEPQPVRLASLIALRPCEVLFIETESFNNTVKEYGLSSWLDRHRRLWEQGGWGCPACGGEGHWLDECNALVLVDEDMDLAKELQPLRIAAAQNFLSTIKSTSRRTTTKSPRLGALQQPLSSTKSGLSIGKLSSSSGRSEGQLARLLEEAQAARAQLTAVCEQMVQVQKEVKQSRERLEIVDSALQEELNSIGRSSVLGYETGTENPGGVSSIALSCPGSPPQYPTSYVDVRGSEHSLMKAHGEALQQSIELLDDLQAKAPFSL